MHKIRFSLATAALLAGMTIAAQADEFAPALSQYLEDEISQWADSVEKQRVAGAEGGALNGARVPF